MTLAVGYVRVSTREQGDSGHGLDAQETTIRALCEARGWELSTIHRDVISSRKDKRAGLAGAIDDAQSTGGVLVAASLSRLARSVGEISDIHARAAREGWGILTAGTQGLDASSPSGKLMIHVLGAVAEWERDIISERTREGLASAKVNGTRTGNPIGRRSALDAVLEDGSPDVETRERARATLDQLRAHRAAGLSFRKTADLLNAMGFTGLQGGTWTDMTVRAAERRHLSDSQTDSPGRRSPSMGQNALSRVLAHAGELDDEAARVESSHEAFLADTARALRDSWRPEGRNYGSIVHGGMGGATKGDNPYAFNGGNANSWHYGPNGRLTLSGYRALYLEWCADPEGSLALPAPEPPATLLADLESAHNLRQRAESYRRNVATLRGEDSWATDDHDRAEAERVIGGLLDTLDNARSQETNA